MNKLTIEHLSGYLPYRVMMWNGKVARPLKRIHLNGVLQIGNDYPFISAMFNKPILIPLEKCYSWSSEMMAIKMDYPDKKKLERFAKGKIKLDDLPYDLVQICFKHHIDIFNLIPQGLAVEKSL